MRLITKIHSLPATKTCGKEMSSTARQCFFFLWGGVIDSSPPPPAALPPHVSPLFPAVPLLWRLSSQSVCLPMISSTSLGLTSLASNYFFAAITKITLDVWVRQWVTTRWGQQFWRLLYHMYFKMCPYTSHMDLSSFFPTWHTTS